MTCRTQINGSDRIKAERRAKIAVVVRNDELPKENTPREIEPTDADGSTAVPTPWNFPR